MAQLKHDTHKGDLLPSQILEKVAKSLVVNIKVVKKMNRLRRKVEIPKLKAEEALKNAQVTADATNQPEKEKRYET